MAENCSKSKLKRKKSSVEDLKSEICSRGAPKRSSVALLSRDGVTHTDRSWFPAAAAWWNMLQPPAVESLWAFTLMSALPHLHNQHWDPVPDLPPPPAARPAAPKVEEWWTYDPFSEVPPFPENGPLTLGLPSDPDLPQQNLPVQSRPDWGPSSHSRQSPEQQTEPPRPILSRSQRPAVHRWEKAAPSSAGQPRFLQVKRRRCSRVLANMKKEFCRAAPCAYMSSLLGLLKTRYKYLGPTRPPTI
ncbi:uncharacterized protein FYW61_004834 isoform 4-T5 [Anableps anableps]